MEKSRKYIDKEWKNIDESRRVALAFQALSGAQSPLALLNRYQARLHHEYQRILKALLQLQACRRADEAKLQNEPKPDAQAAPAGIEPMQPTTAILPYWKALSSNGSPPTATSPSSPSSSSASSDFPSPTNSCSQAAASSSTKAICD
jgi:hypothetical protein